MNVLAKIDHRLSLAIHTLTRRNDFLHTTAVVFARWVFWLLLLWLMVVVFWRRGPIHVLQLAEVLIVANVFGILFNLVLGKIFVRKRPFDTHKLHPLISTHWLGGSFPSDHAMFSFAIATSLWIADPVTGAWAMLVAGLIALSRVAVGVHYVSDVVVGTATGILAAYVSLALV